MYESLGLLLGAYLHQDFLLEYATPDDAVRGFGESEPHRVPGALAEIDDLLDGDLGEQALGDLLTELGSYYRVEADGYTPRSWLSHVRDLLTA